MNIYVCSLMPPSGESAHDGVTYRQIILSRERIAKKIAYVPLVVV